MLRTPPDLPRPIVLPRWLAASSAPAMAIKVVASSRSGLGPVTCSVAPAPTSIEIAAIFRCAGEQCHGLILAALRLG
jgi:hypothetical protein